MVTHILIPTDGTPLSAKALDQGLDLAMAVGARISVLTVTEPFHTFSLSVEQLEDTRQSHGKHNDAHARQVLAGPAAKAAAMGIPCETLHREHAHPWESIIETATSRNCDLIAMASHGRRGVGALLLGSETLRVLTHSTIPVLVLR